MGSLDATGIARFVEQPQSFVTKADDHVEHTVSAQCGRVSVTLCVTDRKVTYVTLCVTTFTHKKLPPLALDLPDGFIAHGHPVIGEEGETQHWWCIGEPA